MGTLNVRSGRLQLDFRYRGVRCREQTNLSDTDRNRRRLSKLLQKIDAEIVLGTFDYARYFPSSPRAKSFKDHDRRLVDSQSRTPRFDRFAESWLDENEVRWRSSYFSTVQGTVNKYLVPQFGEQHLDQIARGDILEFRAELRKRRLKTGQRTQTLCDHCSHTFFTISSVFNQMGQDHRYKRSNTVATAQLMALDEFP